MSFDFLQKKFDDYVAEKANLLFELACHEMMRKPLVNPIISDVVLEVESEKHVISSVIEQTKGLFADAGMRAEILASADNGTGITEFNFVVFDSKPDFDIEKVCTYFWSRSPGKFVNKETGKPIRLIDDPSSGPIFTGTVREWYETLVETIIDASNEIHKKSIDGPADVIRCSPIVAVILECSVLYRPKIDLEGISSPYIGTLANRFKVVKDSTIENDTIEISRVRNHKKWLAFVRVTDMNII